MMWKSFRWALVGVAGAGLAGCQTNAGAFSGPARGATGGGVAGGISHQRTDDGAAMGGAVGALGGSLVTHNLNEPDEREAQAARATEPIYGMERDTGSLKSLPSNKITKNDIIDWTERGVRDDVIIDRIERANTKFKLTATDQNKLRDVGVSEEVIQVMCESARR